MRVIDRLNSDTVNFQIHMLSTVFSKRELLEIYVLADNDLLKDLVSMILKDYPC